MSTVPITLAQKSHLSKKGFLVFSPIYKNQTSTKTVGDRRQNLQGFALGVFMIEDIVVLR
ncbi:CHASE domain-containing protein [Pleurocapsa sp. PCC 7319]|uniref:CHASE domain-containing protein n=1 Tax=Pleurocapsa sp. PCC 7319 TaxID=118161 RepID=UPI000A06D3C1